MRPHRHRGLDRAARRGLAEGRRRQPSVQRGPPAGVQLDPDEVREHRHPPRRAAPVVVAVLQDPAPRQELQHLLELGQRPLEHPGQDRGVDRVPGHRQRLQHPALDHRDLGEQPLRVAPGALRRRQVHRVFGPREAAAVRLDAPEVDEVLHRLLDVQRLALRELVQAPRQLGRRRAATQHVAHRHGHVVRGQRLERDPVRVAQPPHQVRAPVQERRPPAGDELERRLLGVQRAPEPAQQVDRQRVGAVDLLDEQDDRAVAPGAQPHHRRRDLAQRGAVAGVGQRVAGEGAEPFGQRPGVFGVAVARHREERVAQALQALPLPHVHRVHAPAPLDRGLARGVEEPDAVAALLPHRQHHRAGRALDQVPPQVVVLGVAGHRRRLVHREPRARGERHPVEVLERLGHEVRVGRPVGRRLGQQLQDQLGQARVEPGCQEGGVGRGRVQVVAGEQVRVVGLERALPGGEAEQQHAEAVQVGAVVDRLARDLLRGRVREGPHELALLRDPLGRVAQGGGPEVQELDAIVGQHEDVRRLEVAVHDRPVVQVVDGAGEVVADPQHLGGALLGARLPRALHHGLGRLPAQELHRQPRVPLVQAVVVHADDRRVVEAGHRLVLAVEPLERRGDRDQELECQPLARRGILDLVHLRRSARRDGLQDTVGADVLGDGGRHGGPSLPDPGAAWVVRQSHRTSRARSAPVVDPVAGTVPAKVEGAGGPARSDLCSSAPFSGVRTGGGHHIPAPKPVHHRYPRGRARAAR